MNRIKYALAAAGTAAFMLGAAAPVAAQSQNGTNTGTGNLNQSQVVDDSVNIHRTVNGNCSAIMEQEVNHDDQNSGQANVAVPVNTQPVGVGDPSNNQSSSQSNSSSQNQSNSQSFSADCSVTNVTQAAAAQAQVAAPKGGVDAGAGGFGALAGLSGSLATAGYGVLRLRRR